MTEPSLSSRFFDPSRPFANIGQKLVIAITLLACVVLYYIGRYSKGQEVIHTLLNLGPLLVFGMLAAETAYLFFQGCFMAKVYRAVGYRRSVLYTSCMYLAMNLVNTIAPVAGLSGSIYMMHYEKEKGLHRSDTALINFLYYVADYGVFLVVLLAGLLYLFMVGEITRTILATSLVFAVFVFLIAFGGIFLLTHETALFRVLHGFNRLTRFLHVKRRTVMTAAQVKEFVDGAKAAWRRSQGSLGHLGEGSVFALLLHASSLGLLWCAFMAVHVQPEFQLLVAGYTVGTLLNIVSVTPGGIGFAEGGMTAVFVLLGIPVEHALLVALLYRAMFTWYPLFLGLLALHLLPGLSAKEGSTRLEPDEVGV